MFNRFKSKDENLELAIAEVFADLKGFTSETDEHAKATARLTELYALRKKQVDPNVVLTLAGNVAIAGAVLNYERTGVITTKMFQFLGKLH